MAYGDCGDCQFWKEAQIEPSGTMIGQCRVNPPVFGLGSLDALWPRTEHYQGCGRNKPLGKIKREPPPEHTGKPDCTCDDCIPF